MNYLDLNHQLGSASTTDPEHLEREVFVVDEEGFCHVIQGVAWDPDDGCFYIRTTFKAREKN